MAENEWVSYSYNYNPCKWSYNSIWLVINPHLVAHLLVI